MGINKVSRRLVLVIAWTVAAVSLVVSPASADVTSVSGGAFGASINSTLLGQVLAPTPSVTLPGTGGGPFTDSAIPVNIPGLLTADVLTASTEGGLLGTHQGFARSEASLADVTLGGVPPLIPPAITIEAVEASCLSNGDGSSGDTDILGVIAGVPIPQNPTPNFVPPGPLPAGIASIELNEQIVQNSPGGTSIVVNAVHVTLLPTAGTGLLDIIIGQARCAAAGPDVNTGQVAVIKDAPTDAQNVTFTFTITCPGLAGSPFTRTVTGDGTTDPVINVPTGTVCTAAETPVAGFVDQPPQTFAPVVSGATRTVTFTNTRVGTTPTGSVAVVKDAPADAQNVSFTFTITCPGVAGSPFTRTVTGDGTSTAVTGIPVGTVCTAAETTATGFNPQPNQNFPAVTGTGTQTVTFVNTRVGDISGSVAVVKDAPADAQNVTFTFTITCPGAAGSPFTRTVTGDGTSTAVTGLAPGTVCTAAEATATGFNPQPNQTFQAVATGVTRTVTFVNTRVGVTPTPEPEIEVQKSVNPSSRPEPGGTFTFTVRVTNTGDQDVVITELEDSVHGDLDDRGSCETGATLDPGESYTCSFSVSFTGNSGATETDRVTARATDAAGRTATDTSNSVTISITPRGTQVGGPTIIINNNNEATCTSNATAAGQYRIAQINIDNNASAECTSVATSTGTSTPRPTTAPTPAPTHTTPPTGKPLPRTGVDTLAMSAFALALMVSGWAMLSKPKNAGDANEDL